MPAEIIAIANHKGGVTKSFTSVMLATGLAHAGWRTLLVDMDAQANSTSMFDPDSVELDLLDLLKNRVPLDKVIQQTRIENLDLLPSTLAVARLETELVSMHRREDQVRLALEPAVDRYDAMVLDLPPNLGHVVIAGLGAATSLVIPTDATEWGLKAVFMFLTWSEELRQAKVLDAELLGVLLTKYEETTRISKEALAKLQESGLPVFNTRVPKRVAAERMAEQKILIGDLSADEDLGVAYGSLTLEVMDRVIAVRQNRGKHRG